MIQNLILLMVYPKMSSERSVGQQETPGLLFHLECCLYKILLLRKKFQELVCLDLGWILFSICMLKNTIIYVRSSRALLTINVFCQRFRKTETDKHKQNWVRLNMRTRETYSFPRQFSRNIFHFSLEIEKKFQYRQCVFFFFLFFFFLWLSFCQQKM